MKNNSSLCALFGIKQHEMAVILNVSRGQFAMFETGKRDLPPEASLILNELLLDLKSSGNGVEKQIDTKELLLEMELELELLLKENQYQKLLLEKKIEIINKKEQSDLRRNEFINRIKNRSSEFSHSDNKSLKTESVISLLSLKKQQPKNHFELELKQKTLEFQKSFLEAQLQQIKKMIAQY